MDHCNNAQRGRRRQRVGPRDCSHDGHGEAPPARGGQYLILRDDHDMEEADAPLEKSGTD